MTVSRNVTSRNVTGIVLLILTACIDPCCLFSMYCQRKTRSLFCVSEERPSCYCTTLLLLSSNLSLIVFLPIVGPCRKVVKQVVLFSLSQSLERERERATVQYGRQKESRASLIGVSLGIYCTVLIYSACTDCTTLHENDCRHC
jgi:hypothetical protein